MRKPRTTEPRVNLYSMEFIELLDEEKILHKVFDVERIMLKICHHRNFYHAEKRHEANVKNIEDYLREKGMLA